MSFSPDDFDPLGVITDWLDACRAGETTALLDLYDDRATLECDCDGVSLTGRKAVAAYWEPKLDSRLGSAFALDDMVLTGDGVRVDYQNYEGKPVSVHFQFGPTGKIIHTTCGPRGSHRAYRRRCVIRC